MDFAPFKTPQASAWGVSHTAALFLAFPVKSCFATFHGAPQGTACPDLRVFLFGLPSGREQADGVGMYFAAFKISNLWSRYFSVRCVISRTKSRPSGRLASKRTCGCSPRFPHEVLLHNLSWRAGFSIRTGWVFLPAYRFKSTVALPPSVKPQIVQIRLAGTLGLTNMSPAYCS